MISYQAVAQNSAVNHQIFSAAFVIIADAVFDFYRTVLFYISDDLIKKYQKSTIKEQ